MTEIWTPAALWLGLALLATLLSIWLRIATALSEIVVGTIAQLVIGAIIWGSSTWHGSKLGQVPLRDRRDTPDLSRGSGTRPRVIFREHSKKTGAVGVISFLVPFLGCAGATRFLLGWDPMASWLAGWQCPRPR